VRRVVDAALREDGAHHDVTTNALVPGDQLGNAYVVAKADGVLAGVPVAQCAFELLDNCVIISPIMPEGAVLKVGDRVLELEGPFAPILSGERVALNFLQRLSGVATATRRLVEAIAGTQARIVDTRKTTPGLRELERYAVHVGGGQNHRFNLSDGVLIKDNHIAAARNRDLSITQVVEQARRDVAHTLRIEIEVTTFDEADEALRAGADVILLDNMPATEMRRVVEHVQGRAMLEASGGVTFETVRGIAETGVDLISVGAITHSAPTLDLSLELDL